MLRCELEPAHSTVWKFTRTEWQKVNILSLAAFGLKAHWFAPQVAAKIQVEYPQSHWLSEGERGTATDAAKRRVRVPEKRRSET